MRYRIYKICMGVILGSLCLGLRAFGQLPVTSIFFKVTVLPPYSAYLSNYSNNYLVTLTNASDRALTIILKASLSNDHGQSAQTKNNIYSAPIHLDVRQTVTLTGNQIDPGLFNLAKLDNNFGFNTIGNINTDAQLPEDVYTFCLTPYAFDIRSSTYVPLGINPAGGNCATFVISTAKPPIIVTPINEQPIASNTAGVVNISWARPTGVTGRGLIDYTLYIAKVKAGENPNQVMTNVVKYGAGYFYKVPNLVQSVYQLNNLQSFHLEEGATYALMVQAFDNTHTLAIENNGRSEVVSFVYGSVPVSTQSVQIATPPAAMKTVISSTVDKDGNYTLSGKINYAFSPDNFQPGAALPLKNIPIKLIKEYFIYYAEASVNMSLTSNTLQVYQGDSELGSDVDLNLINSHKVKEVAYTTTDANGNFVFTFPSSDKTNDDYGIVTVTGIPDFVSNPTNGKYMPKFGSSVSVYDPNTGKTTMVNVPANNTASERLFSAMSIEILNAYYYGPLVQVPDTKYNANTSNLNLYFVDSVQNNNLGQISAYVGDFNFNVHLGLHVQNGAYDKPADHSKFNVYVLRKKASSSTSNTIMSIPYIPVSESGYSYSNALPPGETQKHYDKTAVPVDIPSIIKNSPYEVVAYAATDAAGHCDFTRMRCFSGDPMYYFYATADAENDMNYAMPQILSLQDLINTNAVNFNNNNATRPMTLTLEPAPGRISGFVRRNDSKVSVKDAQVSLQINSQPNNQVSTDITGYYQFIPFASGVKTFAVQASKIGFLDDAVSFTGSLALGQKIHTDLFIDTVASVYGKIVDKQGNGVRAYVSIENGASVTTQGDQYYTDAQGYEYYTPATFQLGCPKGKQKLIIDPVDTHFEQKTIMLDVEQSQMDQGTIVLDNKVNHVKFVVMQYQGPVSSLGGQYSGDGNYTPPQAKVIQGAKITVSQQGFAATTNQAGEAVLDLYNNNASNLVIKTEGPANANFISNTTAVAIPGANSSNTVYLFLKQGCQVQGFVNYSGKQIAGATVIFKNGAPANWLTTTTDANGYYELHGVPAGNGLAFSAGKQGYVGDVQKGNPSLNKHYTVDFNLTKNGNVDYTQMLGFKMVVTKYDETTHLLSGYFHQLPNNNDFKVLTDTLIPFSNIKVKTAYSSKGDYDYFYPEQMPLRTDLNKIELGAKGYNVRVQLSDPNGLTVKMQNVTPASGVISGLAKVDIAAIQDATNLTFSDELFLRSSASGTLPDNVNTITANGKDPYGTDLYLSNASGKDMNLTYLGFPIAASHLTSAITGNNICHLAGTLTAQIVSDDNVVQKVAIPLSKFDFTDHDGVVNSTQQTNFSIPIQQWKIVGDQYSFGSEGFHINKGHVQTTQVNVPFTDMVLEHNAGTGTDELKYGTYQLQNLDLAGVATLALAPSAVPQFFYDPNQKLWQLIVAGPASSNIGTIQGLTPINQNLQVSEFSLNSKNPNGHLQLSDNSKTVSIYNGLASYTISYIDVSPVTHTLNLSDGILDLGIPQLSYSKNNTLSFYKTNGEVGVNVNPFSLSGYVQGVHLSFQVPKEAFEANGFNVPGLLFETGSNPYQLNVLLNHSSANSSVIIDPNGNKSLFIDKEKTKSINNLSGIMQTVSNNTGWSKFKFEGDLAGCANVSSHLHFTINGDIAVDPGQKVAVASMNTGGESVSSMQFNFATGELRAKINIPKEDLGGGIGFGGSATMVVNKSGWFFAGNASFPNPLIDGAGTVILFGNYPNAGKDPDIASAFSQSFFYKKSNALPPNYQTKLDGFLIDMQVSKNIIPPTSVSWGTGDLDIDFTVSADLYLGAGFKSPKTLDVGGMVAAQANLSASQSLGVVCVNGSAGASIDAYFKGSVATTGQYCLTVGGDFGVQGNLVLKAGGCSGSCNDILGLAPCVQILSVGGGVTLSVAYTMGNLSNCNSGITASLK
jgi:hypothetical protein